MKQAYALNVNFLISRFCFLVTEKKEAGTPSTFSYRTAALTKIPYYVELDAKRGFSPTVCQVMPTTALGGELDSC